MHKGNAMFYRVDKTFDQSNSYGKEWKAYVIH